LDIRFTLLVLLTLVLHCLPLLFGTRRCPIAVTEQKIDTVGTTPVLAGHQIFFTAGPTETKVSFSH
jgi:hypothetical protein